MRKRIMRAAAIGAITIGAGAATTESASAADITPIPIPGSYVFITPIPIPYVLRGTLPGAPSGIHIGPGGGIGPVSG